MGGEPTGCSQPRNMLRKLKMRLAAEQAPLSQCNKGGPSPPQQPVTLGTHHGYAAQQAGCGELLWPFTKEEWPGPNLVEAN